MSDRRVGPPLAKPGASSLIRSVRESNLANLGAPFVPQPEGGTRDTSNVRGVVPATSTPAAKTDVKITVTVGEQLRARLRTAYTLTHVQERRHTFSEFIAAALDAEIERLEQQYNDGEPFPDTESGVVRGRPLGH